MICHFIDIYIADGILCPVYRADTSLISVRGLYLHHQLGHSAMDGRARGRVLQGHRHGRQRHPADVHKPGHQLPDQRTGLWPELHRACDTCVRELHKLAELNNGHVSDRWEATSNQITVPLPSTFCLSDVSLILWNFSHKQVHFPPPITVLNWKILFKLTPLWQFLD